MTDFYQLSPDAGQSQQKRSKQPYEWLAEPELTAQLIDFQNEQQTRLTIQLPDIHCASCVWLLENLHRLQAGVVRVKTNFIKREAAITFNHQELSLRELAELLDRLGYPPHFSLDDTDTSKVTSKPDRSLLYQMGLAGFAFGNIMLLSFPEYLGLSETIDPMFLPVFRYLNLALAIPVVLYSGAPYWRSALGVLRYGKLNLDVPITLGMLALFGRSVIDIVWGLGAGYLDSLAGLLFFLLIGRWFQQRTFDRLSFERDYKAYLPIAATVVRQGLARSVGLDQIRVGDILRIRNGELITADGILQSERAAIDYSFVTGEADPAQQSRGDQLYAGGRQSGAAIDLIVTKPASQSYLRQLWDDEAFSDVRSTASQLVDRLGTHFTKAVLLIALLTLLYWLPRNAEVALHAFSSVLIIACPCALALALPFTFGSVMQHLGRAGLFLKAPTVVERLQSISAVVFDKTGTLTSAEQAELQPLGEALNATDAAYLMQLAQQSGHPRSRQFVQHLQRQAIEPFEGSMINFEEQVGAGLRATFEGREYRIGKASFVGYPAADESVALCWRAGARLGAFQVQQASRANMAEVLAYARSLGPVHLLSGDSDREQARFAPYFASDQLHFSKQPQEKLTFIRKLQEDGHSVLMIGDGLNDAGALRAADVGLVLTEHTNNFVPACDAILSANHFSILPRLLQYARRSRRVLLVAYTVALLYNVVGLSFAVQGLLSPIVAAILMPLSSITIVLIGVFGAYLLRPLHTSSSAA